MDPKDASRDPLMKELLECHQRLSDLVAQDHGPLRMGEDTFVLAVTRDFNAWKRLESLPSLEG